jgi:hypothetical protein
LLACDDVERGSDDICMSRPDENATISAWHRYFSAYALSRE